MFILLQGVGYEIFRSTQDCTIYSLLFVPHNLPPKKRTIFIFFSCTLSEGLCKVGSWLDETEEKSVLNNKSVPFNKQLSNAAYPGQVLISLLLN